MFNKENILTGFSQKIEIQAIQTPAISGSRRVLSASH